MPLSGIWNDNKISATCLRTSSWRLGSNLELYKTFFGVREIEHMVSWAWEAERWNFDLHFHFKHGRGLTRWVLITNPRLLCLIMKWIWLQKFVVYWLDKFWSISSFHFFPSSPYLKSYDFGYPNFYPRTSLLSLFIPSFSLQPGQQRMTVTVTCYYRCCRKFG